MTHAASSGAGLDQLLEGMRSRRRRALGRAITMLENRAAGHRELMRRIYPETGRARVIGVTGPPGAGKSTLVDRLASHYRAAGRIVGILAVDPSSPFSGGAVLGDRVRMQRHYTDAEVFIRSMATRGAMGGLARGTRDAVDLLDAAGFDCILVETVGVGQDEVDIVRTVDLVLVLTVPGLGDEIQAIKAGIMEIADVFVVNKADRDGVDRTLRDLRSVLEMADPGDGRPRAGIVRTIASRGEGIDELTGEIERRYDDLAASGGLEERRRQQLRLRVENILQARALEAVEQESDFEDRLRRAFDLREDPYSIAETLFRGIVDQEDEA